MTFNWQKHSEMYEKSIQKLDIEAWVDNGRGSRLPNRKKVYKDCQVVGGPEGVFAVCRESRQGCSTDLITILSGDDGNWWETMSLDETWLASLIAALRRIQDGKS